MAPGARPTRTGRPSRPSCVTVGPRGPPTHVCVLLKIHHSFPDARHRACQMRRPPPTAFHPANPTPLIRSCSVLIFVARCRLALASTARLPPGRRRPRSFAVLRQQIRRHPPPGSIDRTARFIAAKYASPTLGRPAAPDRRRGAADSPPDAVAHRLGCGKPRVGVPSERDPIAALPAHPDLRVPVRASRRTDSPQPDLAVSSLRLFICTLARRSAQ